MDVGAANAGESAPTVANRLVGLDGLRAAAIMAVILAHSFGTAFEGSVVGVDLFFVISGFIITSRLLLD